MEDVVPDLLLEPREVAFELDHVELVDGQLELTGRWFGVQGRRFMRPTLTVRGDDGETRLLADLAHKPWAAENGEPWYAAFPCDGELDAGNDAELTVAPDLTVEVPVPDEARSRRAGRKRDKKPRQKKRTQPQREAEQDGRPSTQETTLPAARQPAIQDRMEDEQTRALSAARAEIAALRGHTEELGERLERERTTLANELREAQEAKDEALRGRDEAVAGRDEALRSRDQAVAARRKAIESREMAQQTIEQALAARGKAKRAAEQALSQRDEALARLDGVVAERDQASAERDQALAERDQALAERDQASAERDQALAERDQASAERDQALRRHDQELRQRDQLLGQRDEAIAQRDHAAREMNRAVGKRDERARAAERLSGQSRGTVATRDQAPMTRTAPVRASTGRRHAHRLAVAIAFTSLLVVALAVILILSSH